MACECVPAVTDRGSLPAVIVDMGFYVPYGDPEATAGAISKALNCVKGREARERIKRMFPLRKRENELLNEIEELLK